MTSTMLCVACVDLVDDCSHDRRFQEVRSVGDDRDCTAPVESTVAGAGAVPIACHTVASRDVRFRRE